MFIVSLIKISSILLSIVGILFAIPLGFAFYYGESSVYLSFIIPMLASFVFVTAVNIPDFFDCCPFLGCNQFYGCNPYVCQRQYSTFC